MDKEETLKVFKEVFKKTIEKVGMRKFKKTSMFWRNANCKE